jgi:hypothetical protein
MIAPPLVTQDFLIMSRSTAPAAAAAQSDAT